jgi:hypothetical protein
MTNGPTQGFAHPGVPGHGLYQSTDCQRIVTDDGTTNWDRAKQQLWMLSGVRLGAAPPPPRPSQHEVRAAVIEAAVAAGRHTVQEDGGMAILVWKAASCAMCAPR